MATFASSSFVPVALHFPSGPVKTECMEERQARVVVLGAGFGGLSFCQKLRHPAAPITLADRQNHHLFQPLLYQVATAGLSAPDIAQPIRSILHDHPHLTVIMDTVKEVL